MTNAYAGRYVALLAYPLVVIPIKKTQLDFFFNILRHKVKRAVLRDEYVRYLILIQIIFPAHNSTTELPEVQQ